MFGFILKRGVLFIYLFSGLGFRVEGWNQLEITWLNIRYFKVILIFGTTYDYCELNCSGFSFLILFLYLHFEKVIIKTLI